MKNISSISPSTQICAVIGNPIQHSLSPAIHNAAYAALDLDFVYVASRVEDVKGALFALRSLSGFKGFSVTIPHKMEIMKYVDEIPDVDRKIGSINTVVKENDRLIGLGTDGPGALKALLDAGIDLKGKKVMVLGAGGAARAITFTLAQKAGIDELTLFDINKELLTNLSHDLEKGTAIIINSCELTDKSLADNLPDADLIINCTPIGMHPRKEISLVPPELFREEQAVFDVVYTPLKTKLISSAEEFGLKVVPGVEMFVNQAVLQFERFTGEKAPVDIMRRIVMEHLGS